MTATRGPGRPPKHDRAPTEFGRWLDGSGLSVDEFAHAVHVSPACIYRYRRGEQIPTLVVAERILDYAGNRLTLRSFRPG